MTAYKGFKFRLYPTKEQTGKINKTLGCCRYVYNHMLERRIKAYKRRKFSHTIDGRTPKMTITDIIQRLKNMPVMKPKIMVVDEGAILYHPLDEKCKAADWLYAYNEGTQQLMIYNTLDDVLVTANL